MNPLAVVGLITAGAALIAMVSWIYCRAERDRRHREAMLRLVGPETLARWEQMLEARLRFEAREILSKQDNPFPEGK